MTKSRFACLDKVEPVLTVEKYETLFRERISHGRLKPASREATQHLVIQINAARRKIEAFSINLPEVENNRAMATAFASAKKHVQHRRNKLARHVQERQADAHPNRSFLEIYHRQMYAEADAIANHQINELRHAISVADAFVEALEALKDVRFFQAPPPLDKLDFPTGWPDLLPELIHAFRTAMKSTNPSQVIGVSTTGAAVSFVGAVLPHVTGDRFNIKGLKADGTKAEPGATLSTIASEARRLGL